MRKYFVYFIALQNLINDEKKKSVKLKELGFHLNRPLLN